MPIFRDHVKAPPHPRPSGEPNNRHCETPEAFWAHHGVSDSRGAALAEPAIAALESAHVVFATAFDQAPLPKPTSGIVLRALENLSDRIYEQAAGMLVCLGTGSAAAGETIARTVIEGAFNLLYIVSENHEIRLFAFFHQFLKEHERKLDDWQRVEATGRGRCAERNTVLVGIEQQRSAHTHMSDFVKSLAEGLGFLQLEELSKHWPSSLYKRCEQIDLSGQYLTSYHRLSASSHINAEETIRWLMGFYFDGRDGNSNICKRLAIETVSYSAMMTRIAVLHYIRASVATCRALNSPFDAAPIQRAYSDLESGIEAIAEDAGCPTAICRLASQRS
jgi:hypothetical protein